MKLLANKKWHSVILESFLKYKYRREAVSVMDITITSLTQEIIIHNKFQMGFQDMLVLKQNFGKRIMINEITCSMLKYPPNSDYD